MFYNASFFRYKSEQATLEILTWTPEPMLSSDPLILLPMALQSGVGLGLLYNVSPSLSIPCSVSPFI